MRGFSLTTCTSGTCEDWLPAGLYIRAATKASTKVVHGGVLEGGNRSEMPFCKRLRLSESNGKESKSNDKGVMS